MGKITYPEVKPQPFLPTLPDLPMVGYPLKEKMEIADIKANQKATTQTAVTAVSSLLDKSITDLVKTIKIGQEFAEQPSELLNIAKERIANYERMLYKIVADPTKSEQEKQYTALIMANAITDDITSGPLSTFIEHGKRTTEYGKQAATKEGLGWSERGIHQQYYGVNAEFYNYLRSPKNRKMVLEHGVPAAFMSFGDPDKAPDVTKLLQEAKNLLTKEGIGGSALSIVQVEGRPMLRIDTTKGSGVSVARVKALLSSMMMDENYADIANHFSRLWMSGEYNKKIRTSLETGKPWELTGSELETLPEGILSRTDNLINQFVQILPYVDKESSTTVQKLSTDDDGNNGTKDSKIPRTSRAFSTGMSSTTQGASTFKELYDKVVTSTDTRQKGLSALALKASVANIEKAIDEARAKIEGHTSDLNARTDTPHVYPSVTSKSTKHSNPTDFNILLKSTIGNISETFTKKYQDSVPDQLKSESYRLAAALQEYKKDQSYENGKKVIALGTILGLVPNGVFSDTGLQNILQSSDAWGPDYEKNLIEKSARAMNHATIAYPMMEGGNKIDNLPTDARRIVTDAIGSKLSGADAAKIGLIHNIIKDFTSEAIRIEYTETGEDKNFKSITVNKNDTPYSSLSRLFNVSLGQANDFNTLGGKEENIANLYLLNSEGKDEALLSTVVSMVGSPEGASVKDIKIPSSYVPTMKDMLTKAKGNVDDDTDKAINGILEDLKDPSLSTTGIYLDAESVKGKDGKLTYTASIKVGFNSESHTISFDDYTEYIRFIANLYLK